MNRTTRIQWPPRTLMGWLVFVATAVVGGALALLFGVVLLAVLGVAVLLSPLLYWWVRRRMRQAAPPPPRRDGPRILDVEAEVKAKE